MEKPNGLQQLLKKTYQLMNLLQSFETAKGRFWSKILPLNDVLTDGAFQRFAINEMQRAVKRNAGYSVQ